MSYFVASLLFRCRGSGSSNGSLAPHVPHHLLPLNLHVKEELGEEILNKKMSQTRIQQLEKTAQTLQQGFTMAQKKLVLSKMEV